MPYVPNAGPETGIFIFIIRIDNLHSGIAAKAAYAPRCAPTTAKRVHALVAGMAETGLRGTQKRRRKLSL